MNWDIIKFIVEYANKKNKKYGLKVNFLLVTNLTLMDEEKLKFIIENKITVSTSLDGPEFLHNWNRPFT